MMKAQIVEGMIDATKNPTKVGQKVIHEDDKEYIVTKILNTEVKTNGNGRFIHVTWVNIEPK